MRAEQQIRAGCLRPMKRKSGGNGRTAARGYAQRQVEAEQFPSTDSQTVTIMATSLWESISNILTSTGIISSQFAHIRTREDYFGLVQFSTKVADCEVLSIVRQVVQSYGESVRLVNGLQE